uniref:Ulp1 protease family, C-terminal catalytic domain containing protein n=1 Tax=Solanum tuberosum TaxID=4113 RepID=M0ZNV8_SOLTU
MQLSTNFQTSQFNVAPLSVIIPPQLTNNDDFLSDSQLPTQLPIKKSAHNLDTKTPAPRNRIPSKILQSPYVNTFGSIDKGKGKIDDDIRPYTPLEECGITYQVLSLLMQEYSQWIQKGLLKTHANNDCGTYVAAFAEFLSNEIKVPSIPFQSEYLRSRYATLLWKYGTNKANAGYVSENDDHIRLKAASILLADDELFNVE